MKNAYELAVKIFRLPEIQYLRLCIHLQVTDSGINNNY